MSEQTSYNCEKHDEVRFHGKGITYMSIAFICPYPHGVAPSQRFRFEQYLYLLTAQQINYEIFSFLSPETWRVWYNSGNTGLKILGLTKGVIGRVTLLFRLHRFDVVFIHREACPFGPPLFEWIISKVLRKKIIYDFDDAIWLTDKQNENWFEKILRSRSKVGAICRWSTKVSVGNEYLGSYASQFNTHVIVNPTTIDTNHQHVVVAKPVKPTSEIIIGWTGSHSTLKFLSLLVPVLQDLQRKYPQVVVMIIADRPPNFELKNLVFKKWSKESEIADLSLFDIGIMPLPDDAWSRGKCGFKALQYMAMEMPCVISPVGVNSKIVDHGINGFLCETASEWSIVLERLILNAEERNKVGKQARKKVVEFYSVDSNSFNFLSLFQRL